MKSFWINSLLFSYTLSSFLVSKRQITANGDLHSREED